MSNLPKSFVKLAEKWREDYLNLMDTRNSTCQTIAPAYQECADQLDSLVAEWAEKIRAAKVEVSFTIGPLHAMGISQAQEEILRDILGVQETN